MHTHQPRHHSKSSTEATLQKKTAAAKDQVSHSATAGSSEAMSLQEVIGNRNVQRMLVGGSAGKMPIQAKMTVGPVGDKYEQEADQVAGQVVQQLQMRSAAGAIQRESEGGELEEEELQMKPEIGAIQRESEGGELEEEELQMKPEIGAIQRESEGGELEEEELQMKPEIGAIQRESEGGELEEEELQMKPEIGAIQRESEGGELEEEELQMKPEIGAIQRESEGGELEGEELQMKSAGEGFDVTPSIEQRIQSKSGSGSKMDGNTLSGMEQAFGADFGDVSIHHDSEAGDISRSIGAQAFTQGKDVFFGNGKYDPGSQGGQELLAHELTHVVQQTGGSRS
ncbi:eCIS core domain-containing protein [Paenibacillus sp. FSL H8-0034]|uniref:eCIS core domain-containing protein n=1 Tax=Paenibacillus sp. FSL H8-0034 TaxID=2954671 RepID=UPI0030FC50CA